MALLSLPPRPLLFALLSPCINRPVTSLLGRSARAARLQPAGITCHPARPATHPPPRETAYGSAGRSIDPCPLWSDGPAACGQLSLPFCANPNCHHVWF